MTYRFGPRRLRKLIGATAGVDACRRSATFTIVMSIALMNIATQMSPRPQALVLNPSCARRDGANWMKWGASMAAYTPAPERCGGDCFRAEAIAACVGRDG
jgi:hypothetical protein